jgi:hypothetical protein
VIPVALEIIVQTLALPSNCLGAPPSQQIGTSPSWPPSLYVALTRNLLAIPVPSWVHPHPVPQLREHISLLLPINSNVLGDCASI